MNDLLANLLNLIQLILFHFINPGNTTTRIRTIPYLITNSSPILLLSFSLLVIFWIIGIFRRFIKKS